MTQELRKIVPVRDDSAQPDFQVLEVLGYKDEEATELPGYSTQKLAKAEIVSRLHLLLPDVVLGDDESQESWLLKLHALTQFYQLSKMDVLEASGTYFGLHKLPLNNCELWDIVEDYAEATELPLEAPKQSFQGYCTAQDFATLYGLATKLAKSGILRSERKQILRDYLQSCLNTNLFYGNQFVPIGQRELCLLVGMNPKSKLAIQKHLKSFQEEGWLIWKSGTAGIGGKANEYRLSDKASVIFRDRLYKEFGLAVQPDPNEETVIW